MAAVKHEFSIGVLKAFYSIFCVDILLVCISRNAVSENKKNRPPKFHRSAPVLKETPKQYIEVYYRILISALFGETF